MGRIVKNTFAITPLIDLGAGATSTPSMTNALMVHLGISGSMQGNRG